MLPETIDHARFRLRPFRPDDLADVYAYAQDEEFLRYLPIDRPYTHDTARGFLAMVAEMDPARRRFWAIEVDGAASGGINVRFVVEHRVGEIGYALARRLWGRGL